MFNAFGKLWLTGARYLAKVQRAEQKKLQRTLQKSLTPRLAAPAKPRAAKRTPSLTAALLAKPGPATRRTVGKPGKAVDARLDAGGSWLRSYHSAPAGSRSTVRRLTYWLFVPHTLSGTADGTGARAGKGGRMSGLPLVIMLHGCDQTAPDFAAGTRMNRLAARQGFAVLYPQQSARAHPHRCWPWYRRSLQEGRDELVLIAGMAEKLIARHGFDRSRVYAAGLSAGAAMAHVLALRHPDLIAAVALHSGPAYGLANSRLSAFTVMQQGGGDAVRPIDRVLAETPDFPPMPVLVLQGEQDGVVRPVNAGQLVLQACALNRLQATAHAGLAASVPAPAVETVPTAARQKSNAFRMTDYRCGSATLVRLYEIEGLAHAWSGGDASLQYHAAKGPDASLLVWNFFKRHRRVGEPVIAAA